MPGMSDPNCAHCNGALHLTQQARDQRLPPHEAVRTALLTGVVVGATGLSDAHACEDCRAALDAIHQSIQAAAQLLGPGPAPARRPAQAPQGTDTQGK
jgi:ABC-type amino acid transport system permease subunit